MASVPLLEKKARSSPDLTQSSCGEQALVLVVVKVGEVDDLRRLFADDPHDARVGVAERVDAQPGEQVEIAFALDVIQVDAFAARHGDRIASVGVEQVFLFAFNDFLICHDEALEGLL